MKKRLIKRINQNRRIRELEARVRDLERFKPEKHVFDGRKMVIPADVVHLVEIEVPATMDVYGIAKPTVTIQFDGSFQLFGTYGGESKC